MEQINIISFTKKGESLANKLGEYLKEEKLDPYEIEEEKLDSYETEVEKLQVQKKQIQLVNKCKSSDDYSSVPLSECAKESFEKKQGLIFVGAAGIAVRTIAPYLKDKLHDPFVIVIDEKGSFVIPILSGHVGQANEYARKIASFLGAQAVITTATDINHCFAADLFAQKNHFMIQNKEGIAKVSAKTLSHKNVTVQCQNRVITLSYDGKIVKEESLEDYQNRKKKESEKNQTANLDEFEFVPIDIIISPFLADREKGTLWLVPPCIVVGVGCRRGKEASAIEQTILDQLTEHGIAKEAVCAIASIDRKKDEIGLIETAKKMCVPFVTFSEETLRMVPGNFTASPFVEKTVGVDNVCERSSIAAAPGGHLLSGKYAKDGVTVAIAQKLIPISF